MGPRCEGSSSLCGFNKVRLEKSTVTERSRGTVVGLGGAEVKGGGLALNAECTAEHKQPARVQGAEGEQPPARLFQGCGIGN